MMFKNPFYFTGRIRRLEYGISWLILILFSEIYDYILKLLEKFFNINIFDNPYIETSDFIVACLGYWFILAQGCKRSHDLTNPGWFQIVPFYVFWILVIDGDLGENEYGENPKGIGNNRLLYE